MDRATLAKGHNVVVVNNHGVSGSITRSEASEVVSSFMGEGHSPTKAETISSGDSTTGQITKMATLGGGAYLAFQFAQHGLALLNEGIYLAGIAVVAFLGFKMLNKGKS